VSQSSTVSTRSARADKVRWLRAKGHQKGLRLVVHCDGDNLGTPTRKDTFNDALEAQQLAPRLAAEAIAILIPTWSTETWLLGLFGEQGVNESQTLKRQFERRKSMTRDDLRDAAAAWGTEAGVDLPSLIDGRAEFQRIV